jgi:hypothetical protein
VVHDINEDLISKGEVFINLMDNDLVVLIERIIESKLKVGKDVGVISYNETPLKKIILMASPPSPPILKRWELKRPGSSRKTAKRHVQVPFSLTLRSSL